LISREEPLEIFHLKQEIVVPLFYQLVVEIWIFTS